MDLKNQKVTSAKYRVNWKDVSRSFIIAIVTPVVVELQRVIDSGVFNPNWKNLAMIGVGGGLAYLIKNFFTPASVQIPIKDEEIDKTKPEAAK